MNFNRSSFANRVYFLVCFAFEIDGVDPDAEEFGEMGANFHLAAAQSRLFEDDRGIEIADSVPSFADDFGRSRQEPA